MIDSFSFFRFSPSADEIDRLNLLLPKKRTEADMRKKQALIPATREKLLTDRPKSQSLSRAALETLSIIAYKQPITRIEIDAIRGVNSSGALAKLQAFDLIREDGKKEVLGRPNLYVTTDYFLDYMGINHLEELPVIDELEIQAQESQLFGERIEEDENQ